MNDMSPMPYCPSHRCISKYYLHLWTTIDTATVC